MVVVRVPALVADQADGQREFEVEGSTLGEALRGLPVADLLLDEHGELRRLVNVYVDGEDVRRAQGLDTPIAEAQEIQVIAAVAGGQVPYRQYTPASRPRSRGARGHPPPHQGNPALARRSARSGLVLPTEKLGSITCRGTRDSSEP